MAKRKNAVIMEFTRKLSMVNTAYRQFIQNKLRENNVNLTFEMLQVLTCLWHQDGINQQEIANITVKDKASMTYLIDNLVKRDLVYRAEDNNDRRNKLIYLTRQGARTQEQIQPFLDDMHKAAGMHIDSDLLKQAMVIIEQVEKNLKA
jgi:DNA-binding MarR family transcriptional regulator